MTDADAIRDEVVAPCCVHQTPSRALKPLHFRPDRRDATDRTDMSKHVLTDTVSAAADLDRARSMWKTTSRKNQMKGGEDRERGRGREGERPCYVGLTEECLPSH